MFHAMLGFAQNAWNEFQRKDPKWRFDGDLPWYKEKQDLQKTKVKGYESSLSPP